MLKNIYFFVKILKVTLLQLIKSKKKCNTENKCNEKGIDGYKNNKKILLLKIPNECMYYTCLCLTLHKFASITAILYIIFFFNI